MADTTDNPQQIIDEAAKTLVEPPVVPPTSPTPPPTPVVPETPTPPPVESVPQPESLVVPPKDQKPEPPPQQIAKPPKKKGGKGMLIGILIFFILTLPVAVYYGAQQYTQLTETRSKAAGGTCKIDGSKYYANTATCVGPNVQCGQTTVETTCKNNAPYSLCCQWVESTAPTPTPKNCTLHCLPLGDCGSTKIGGVGYGDCGMNEYCCSLKPTPTQAITVGCPGNCKIIKEMPNHVICGTCDPATNTVSGTWEVEDGFLLSSCGNCNPTISCKEQSTTYPWEYNGYCLSNKTTTKELSIVSADDCARVVPCEEVVPTGKTVATHTPVPPTTTDTPITPTDTPANTPAPGVCDSSCDSDSNCESGLSCIISTGVKRCRNAACPNEVSCSCPAPTAVPTTPTYVNPTQEYVIANLPVSTPTERPTPKVPVAGGLIDVKAIVITVGSVLLLVLGLIL
jgi:hypothetical protein